MILSRNVSHAPLVRVLLAGVLALAPLGAACAWQNRAQASGQQYRQTAQQQQTRDQLQKSQLQQQLRQGVSDNARRPNATDARTQRQQDEADRAQRARDRANQQDLLDRERGAPVLPRVVPKDLPTPAHSG
ncbi:hypothetical protein ACFPME_02140 [Rhodanobacter umsongensis]|uniref:Uncharacterized protein n=1 Tax=Rhodanobacter umsongensis TaxID=633153 RepID=A0ABW0JHI4_9GAMM